jgi:hypothetical protein
MFLPPALNFSKAANWHAPGMPLGEFFSAALRASTLPYRAERRPNAVTAVAVTAVSSALTVTRAGWWGVIPEYPF